MIIIRKTIKHRQHKESLSLRFLYHTVPGRCVLKGLVQPGVSRAAGRFLDSALSARLVPGFVRRHRIDMTAYRGQRYTSFNAFFTRKKQEGALSETEGILLSPCDAFLSAYPIGDDSVFRIKHVEYSLAQLLRDQKVAGRFAGGTCLIFRLTPQHYHRYCYACSGRLRLERTIPGVLHTVRPVAYTKRPVFIENSREYVAVEAANGAWIVQMEVGALLVGKICNARPSAAVTAGEEKGYFAFGGSTIILLLESGCLAPEGVLADALADAGAEHSVEKGTRLGVLQ